MQIKVRSFLQALRSDIGEDYLQQSLSLTDRKRAEMLSLERLKVVQD
jgi:hypothetical protein